MRISGREGGGGKMQPKKSVDYMSISKDLKRAA
jgi:hypothetical protein